MLRVTGLAAGGVDASVKADLLFNVAFNFLVARKTFIKKNLLDEIVTVQTLTLIFLMKPGYVTGHHSLQDIKGVCDSPGCEQKYQNSRAGSFPHQASLHSLNNASKILIRRQYERST